MNTLNGKISAIEVNGSLTSVAVKIGEITLKSIVIETPETVSYLEKGHDLKVLFKETEVIIGTGDTSNISLQNKIPGNVISIEKGTLVSKITIESKVGKITAVISTSAVESLNLEKGQAVTAMIKTNEILLSE
jgi:molybdopterin-binding protein